MRLPKVVQIFDTEKFENLLIVIYSDSKNDKIMTLNTLRYFYKIVRLLLIAMVITYFAAGFWFIICNEVIKKKNPGKNFVETYNLTFEKSNKSSFEKYNNTNTNYKLYY